MSLVETLFVQSIDHCFSWIYALLIYGEGFSFMVNESEDWHCFTADAGKYGLNAIFAWAMKTLLMRHVLNKQGGRV